MTTKLAAIILAAGQGKRMRSRLPKVLHPCAGEPLIVHVVRLALSRKATPVVVVIDPAGTRTREVLTAAFPKAPLKFAVQEKPLGTGDAARAGLAVIPSFTGKLLILCGDAPLLRPDSLALLERAAKKASLALLTAHLPNPHGYGRILRAGHQALGIVEEKDATPEQRDLHEVNAGVYLCDADLVRKTVTRQNRANAQGEAYLTDLVARAAQAQGATPVTVADATEILGTNTRTELADAEQILRRRMIRDWQAEGVAFADPGSVILEGSVKLGADAHIGPGVQMYGQVRVGAGAIIEGPSVLRDANIEAGARVYAFSHIEGATVKSGAAVGPFARLRKGAILEEDSRVGNFVELKKTRLGRGAKANHLAYLGDAEIGAKSNIGAGTITCNYDGGPVKHATALGEGAFIGSNTTLVAPVTVAAGAYVAAGSTITKDVPADALAFGRARQENREGLAARLRARIHSQGQH